MRYRESGTGSVCALSFDEALDEARPLGRRLLLAAMLATSITATSIAVAAVATAVATVVATAVAIGGRRLPLAAMLRCVPQTRRASHVRVALGRNYLTYDTISELSFDEPLLSRHLFFLLAEQVPPCP